MQPLPPPPNPLLPTSEPTGLAERFELFRPYLLALANREMPPGLIGGCSGSDLVQETFLAAHHKQDQFHGSSAEELLAWLRAILRYQILHLRRKQRTASAARLPGPGSAMTNEPASPDLQLENQEDYLRILRLVQRLPELQRQIIEGRIERDQTFKEIGRRLDMTEEATRKAFHRAIEQLRGCFFATMALAQTSRRDDS